MIRDRFGFAHSSPRPEAAGAFADATFAILAHRPEAGAALAAAEAADPTAPSVQALKGFAAVILGRGELAPTARAALAAAEGGATRATPDEEALIAALKPAVAGDLGAAGRMLADRATVAPRAALVAKLSQALAFMAGDAQGMLRLTAEIALSWDRDCPGYGFMLGLHAFALEETGDLGAAEATGRRAVAAEPADAWGAHAVAHVCETQARAADGIAWIETRRPGWSRCNNFAFHMAWHLALCHLERGDAARALALYDAEVRPAPTEDVRDVANAASLLWRLRQEGAPLGERWDELRAIALRRRGDATLAFASLHHLLSLVATGETQAAADLVSSLEAEAGGAGERAAAAAVAAPLARLIAGSADPAERLALARLATELPRLGGSHVQRDVFLRSLAEIALGRGDCAAMAELMRLRRRVKRNDRFAARLCARAA